MQIAPENTPTTSSSSPAQDYSTRVFWFALELIPYFGLPAIVGFFVNKKVLALYPESGMLATTAIFTTTYIFSWVVVVWRYRTIKQQHKK